LGLLRCLFFLKLKFEHTVCFKDPQVFSQAKAEKLVGI